MNGLEALENIKATYRVYDNQGNDIDPMHYEYSIIENELKVLNILKEKRVDLMLIKDIMRSMTNKGVEDYLSIYNKAMLGYRGKTLTLKEMTLIVDWLKGGGRTKQ